MYNQLEKYLWQIEDQLVMLPTEQRREEVREIRLHLERMIEENIARGFDADEKTGLTISSELHVQMKDVFSMSTSNKIAHPAIPSSLTIYVKRVARSWTVKLPQ